MDATVKKPRGFAALSPEQRAEISRKGGRAAHEKGTAHQFDTEEARAAGRKGGIASHDALRRRKAEEAAAEPEKA